ncbi:adenosylcobinamide-GDP ribazoletransferase [Ottowia testudinis]|uniref:Adenosylcobinamide-GDP ribazoletransferase n=1 Tax=Ottowia testudinis TaxID=2816950 RepID=A0A975CI37_9BURK|nr:adenosylcobinamide-GDP ribazoletransferase [Ottowia testudinis]QTD46853.1 adenosylcobinamide-GDP ribazoletransferase [Ottowia testudinis]
MNLSRTLRHFLLALQFFTRIPITGRLAAWVGYSPAMLRAIAGHFPGVVWVVGAVAAGVLAAALYLLPPGPLGALVAAGLAAAATVWLTGAFHEDGLADTADGLGGGAPRERALAIMKDSRIGSYGTAALLLALGLKVALTALLAERGAGVAALAVWGTHVLSRAAPLDVMWGLPYAGEADGSKAKPLADAISLGGILTGIAWALPALGLLWWALGWRPTLAAMALWMLALGHMRRLLRRRLQGFTGDTLGATQQVCELALLLGLALAW